MTACPGSCAQRNARSIAGAIGSGRSNCAAAGPAARSSWDRVAARESEKNPIFKEVYESQKKWASVTVPMKKVYFPPYAIAADYYWPDKK